MHDGAREKEGTCKFAREGAKGRSMQCICIYIYIAKDKRRKVE